ncbi:MAG: lycopene cyclase domain-containing protein [Pleurocapsa minor GSE-CHR-MK-17-07R]|jgi:lycopene cyclase domain-containing protein|nr:lycopene cyclase domain-containing protein [Pleurocapsa minor GSE-CHR-MK 17-07R]
MKYFGFLLRFVMIPLTLLSILGWWDRRRGKREPGEFRGLSPKAALTGLVTVAVAWTTPWDNYLVRTKVWWYDRKLVTGIVLGYVPIEEYTFFVVQTLLTGSWMLTLMRWLPLNKNKPANPLLIRFMLTATLGAVWLWSTWNLIRGPKSRTYLTLTLTWALLPIMFQTAFGGDILWQHKKLVALGFVPSTLYLALSDSLAIESGTWKINPSKTVNVDVGNGLPLEEGLFFLLTNVLIAVGMTLVLSKQSRERVPAFLRKYLPPSVDDAATGKAE